MRPRVLVLGAGGLGCAALLALGRSGRALSITIVDPDRVERSNLPRQVLYGESDAGHGKARLAAERLRADRIEARGLEAAFDAEGALALVRQHDLVIEGTDRHEAKLLAADAAALGRVPIAQGGLVGWAGWALGARPFESACLRCLFEDVPAGAGVPTCAENGVVGPAVGALGTLLAELGLGLLDGRAEAAGRLFRLDLRAGTARSSVVRRRPGCALCGEPRAIHDLAAERYLPACAP